MRFWFVGRWYRKGVACLVVYIRRSSNGRTAGSGPADWGSSPYLRTDIKFGWLSGSFLCLCVLFLCFVVFLFFNNKLINN